MLDAFTVPNLVTFVQLFCKFAEAHLPVFSLNLVFLCLLETKKVSERAQREHEPGSIRGTDIASGAAWIHSYLLALQPLHDMLDAFTVPNLVTFVQLFCKFAEAHLPVFSLNLVLPCLLEIEFCGNSLHREILPGAIWNVDVAAVEILLD